MKRLPFYLSLLLLVVFVSSCASVSKTGYAAPFTKTEVHTDILKADLDIDKNRVEASASSTYLFGMWRISGDNKFTEAENAGLQNSVFGGRVDRVKSAAMYKALQKTNADMLITPKYDTETKSYIFGLIKTYNVKVSGYNAKIKDLQQLDFPLEQTIRQINE